MADVGAVPVRLPNGNIRAPRRAEGPDGIVGDALVELRPGDPGFDGWSEWLDAGPMPED